MRQTPFSEDFRQDLIRRFEAGELADFLEITVEQIIEEFESEITEMLDRLVEELYGTGSSRIRLTEAD